MESMILALMIVTAVGSVSTTVGIYMIIAWILDNDKRE